MFKQKSAMVVPLTPDLVSHLHAVPGYKRDRGLKPGRVQYLEGEVKAGTVTRFNFDFAWLRGIKYRVNGQHTLHVLSQANGHFPHGCLATITEYECDTDADLALLWSKFDSVESSRSFTEIVGVHVATRDDLRDVPTRRVERLVIGVSIAMGNGSKRKVGNAERAKLIHEHADFILWGQQFAASRLFERGSVLGAMFQTFRVSPEVAFGFWTLVRDATHPDASNPTRWLNNLLKEVSLGGGDMAIKRSTVKKKTTSLVTRAIYVKCIHAWNAYRRGTGTDGKYHPDGPVPKVL